MSEQIQLNKNSGHGLILSGKTRVLYSVSDVETCSDHLAQKVDTPKAHLGSC